MHGDHLRQPRHVDDHPDRALPELLQDPGLHRNTDALEDSGQHFLNLPGPAAPQRTAVPPAGGLSGGCAAAS
ncbi:hypothetical protein SCOCK_460022 [Actinacidiphila cocklensis]|uniref:Uncharacterized protein n=1 Tax=Actinacidiphila cocklensis TaxID=887465 RepID=A0A9W4E9Z0_9ACTN|nr:hypothetical protein SCOCK_460022 [Actinacidiphila cocklensis]